MHHLAVTCYFEISAQISITWCVVSLSIVSCPRKLSRFFTAFPKNGTVSLILKSGQFFYSLSTLAFLTSPHIVEARGIGFIRMFLFFFLLSFLLLLYILWSFFILALKSWRPIHGTYAETTNPRTPMYSLLGHCSSRIVLQHNPTIVSGGRFYMYQDRRGGCSRNQYHDQSQVCPLRKTKQNKTFLNHSTIS